MDNDKMLHVIGIICSIALGVCMLYKFIQQGIAFFKDEPSIKNKHLRRVKYCSNTYPEYEYSEAFFHCFANEYCNHMGVKFAKSVAVLEDEDGKVFHVDGNRVIKFLN